MPATRALLAGVSGINRYYRYACNKSLVLDEAPKLEEGPACMPGSFRFPNRCPFVDMCQVFDCNPTSGVFGFLNELLADAMIHIGSKSCLLPVELLQMALGTSRTSFLEATTQSEPALSALLDSEAREDLSVAINGDIDDTHIYTDKPIWVYLWQLRCVDRGQQIEDPVNQDKIRLTFTPVNSGSLVSSYVHEDIKAAINSPDADSFDSFVPQDTVIVCYCTKWLESVLMLFICLIGITDFTDSPDSHLSRQTELISDVIVTNFLEIVL